MPYLNAPMPYIGAPMVLVANPYAFTGHFGGLQEHGLRRRGTKKQIGSVDSRLRASLIRGRCRRDHGWRSDLGWAMWRRCDPGPGMYVLLYHYTTNRRCRSNATYRSSLSTSNIWTLSLCPIMGTRGCQSQFIPSRFDGFEPPRGVMHHKLYVYTV
ncbi:hypothetical protein PLICRDRAFT_281007 [Plicaturopsis crispa FD-325 SS-3]|nr:hypothetical protein PLICRDRAFT_281007 [Plicaturopsis crispa FD-325 SS-3]